MKNLNLLLALMMLMGTFAACTKEAEDMTITFNESASLSLTLVDDNGDAIADQGVHLYSSDGDLIDYQVTDENGSISYGELLTNQYSIRVKNIELNGTVYNVVKSVQIIAGSSKKVTINPADYTASIEATFINGYDSSEKIEGLYVYAVSSEDAVYINTIDDIKSRAFASDTTDTNGVAALENVPSDLSFRIYYTSADESFVSYATYDALDRGDIKKITWEIDLSDVTFNFSNYNTDEIVEGVNVLLVDYSDFYNLDEITLENIKTCNYSSTISDDNGEANFDNVWQGTYMVVYYVNENDLYYNDYYMYDEEESYSYYLADFEVTVYDDNYGYYEGINVALINEDFYYSLDSEDRTLENLLEGAIATGTTDSEGSFIKENTTLSSNYYMAIAYTDDKSSWAISDYFYYRRTATIYF